MTPMYENDCDKCNFVSTIKLPRFDEPVDVYTCKCCTKKGFLIVYGQRQEDNQSVTGEQLITFMRD